MTVIKNVPKSLANNRLDKVAASLFPDFSRTQIKKWILEGRILSNGDLSKPKDMTQENDEIEINPIEEKKFHGIKRILILMLYMIVMITS